VGAIRFTADELAELELEEPDPLLGELEEDADGDLLGFGVEGSM